MTNHDVIDLGYRPRPWQTHCHASERRFNVKVVHRRAGKTTQELMKHINACLKATAPLHRSGYVAPLLKQVVRMAWRPLLARIQPLVARGIASVDKSDHEITFRHNGATLSLIGGDDPDSIRGSYFDLVTLDEFPLMKPELWSAVIRPMLADRKGSATFIGTPRGTDHFYDLFQKHASSPDWFTALFTVYDTHAIAPDEVEALRQEMPKDDFAREFMCDFTVAAINQLISVVDVMEAMRRHAHKPEYESSPKVLGIDCAREGNDRTVFFPRQGIVALKPEVYASIGNSMTLVGKAAAKIREWKPDAVFIDRGGEGGAVSDRLRELGFTNVHTVNFGETKTVIKPWYANKRTEMWCEMADWIMEGGILPDMPELRVDLTSVTYFETKNGQRNLSPKKQIKAAGLPSPDLGDALALTFAMPVMSQAESEIIGLGGKVRGRDYDPFASS